MSENQYTGALGDTGIDLTIIDGGQGMGEGQDAIQTLTAGNLKFNVTADMAFVSSDDLAIYSEAYPATGVVAPLDKSPQMLFWDPETYPDGFSLIDDLAALEDADGDPKIYLRSITDSYGKYLVDRQRREPARQQRRCRRPPRGRGRPRTTMSSGAALGPPAATHGAGRARGRRRSACRPPRRWVM